jgi:uncharacterized Fe-S cluster protein YjdI
MQEYSTEKIAVRYDEKICIHAGKCVRSLPQVFDVNKQPWINVNGAVLKQSSRPLPSVHRVLCAMKNVSEA